MLVLFLILSLVSVVLLIIGFTSPGLVIRWGTVRTRRQSVKVYGTSTLICIILLFATWVHSANSSKAPAEWNTSDSNAASNGNITLAVQWLQSTSQSIKLSAASPEPNAVFKKPWEYYGQVVKLTGKVTSAKDYSSNSNVSKELGTAGSEIVITTKDQTDIDFLMAGQAGQVKVGDTVSVYGYPVGHESVANKLGGKTSELVVVGNAFDDPAS